MKKFLYIFFILLVSASSSSYAFEYVDQKQSYENSKYLSFRLGMGVHTFFDNGNVKGKLGPAFQFGVLHPLTKGVDLEFVYQFSTFRFHSPDPIISSQDVDTRTGMHHETLRGIFYLPHVMAQPFLSIGFGGYHFTGLDSKTALDFGYSFEVPVGVGVRAYLRKNTISLQFEYVYHFLLGDNQSASTLSLLNRNEFNVDAYTMMGSLSFHFF